MHYNNAKQLNLYISTNKKVIENTGKTFEQTQKSSIFANTYQPILQYIKYKNKIKNHEFKRRN